MQNRTKGIYLLVLFLREGTKKNRSKWFQKNNRLLITFMI